MVGGMGLISVPSSCSMRYLREPQTVIGFPVASSAKDSAVARQCCSGQQMSEPHDSAQVEAVVVGDEVDREAQVAEPS